MVKIHTVNTSQRVLEFDLTDHVDLDDLRQALLEYKSQYPRSDITGFNSWHSGYYAHKKIPQLANLATTIENLANNHILDQSRTYTVGAKFVVKECLFHDYPVFGATDWHDHHPLCYATAFYVSADKTSDICFPDYKITPESGKLLMFPGFLLHKVSPRLAKHGERLVVSMNLYPVLDFSVSDQIAEKNLNNFVNQY